MRSTRSATSSCGTSPTQVVMDRGKEFMAEFSEIILKDYGVKKRPITVRNPQANNIIERIHQNIGNMI
eukprot:7001065-Ditylum_brightwellii.AAC.1